MLRTALQRLRKLGRFMLVKPRQLSYQRQIAGSTYFDPQFYREQQGHNWMSARFPIRHFVLFGERNGLRPCEEFQPNYYLAANPDVAVSAYAPLEHYIRIGHIENRVTRPVIPDDKSRQTRLPILRPVDRQARFAIVLHLYYHDLWPELLEQLEAIDINFDLYVTLTDKEDETDATTESILNSYPGARIYRFPNIGRDIFPFLHLANAGLLDGYEAVAKLHTKRSPHRDDGEDWRRALISGILPAQETAALLERFLAQKDGAIMVANGNVLAGDRWWGSNRDVVRDILARVELTPDPDRLSFPAGSIYWLKPLMISMLRGLRLDAGSFPPEAGQVDGTTAHGVERALGYFAQAAGQRVLQTGEVDREVVSPPPRPSFVSAFYLPQFHPTPENDAWWGQGFTEWRSVTQAAPCFPDHHQPFLPGDLSFYDLRVPEVMGQQFSLANAAGIDAFCVYHYWFDGERLLEKPLDNLLTRPDIPFGFYLCWANESWRRNWDGLSGDVLVEQTYRLGFEDALVADTIPYFTDPRYAHPDGKRPRFVIYRPSDMPDPAHSIRRMRQAWVETGIGEVELGAVLFHGDDRGAEFADLFDFMIEMPPHGLVKPGMYLAGGDAKTGAFTPGIYPGFEGMIYDYITVAETSGTAPDDIDAAHVIPGLMPSWDNTARRGMAAHIAYGANPATFAKWLDTCLRNRVPDGYRRELFLNAWNEWGEKAVLEPSKQFGAANLDVLRTALQEDTPR